MSNIFYKKNFNISLDEINNNKSTKSINDLISWEMNKFHKEFKIINFIENTLYLKIKNKIDCEINFENLSCFCNNLQINELIKKNLNNDIETFLNNIHISLQNIDIENEKNNDNQNWNPYKYLNSKTNYSFNINLLKEKAYKKNFINTDIPKEHIINTILDEIKVLDQNNYELIFTDDNLFNFDIKLKDLINLQDVIINIDLNSFHYPYYPPLLGFYNIFNDEIVNKITNSPFLKIKNWSKLETKNLLIIVNYIKNIINENVVDISEDSNKVNSILSKIISLNEIKLYNTDEFNLDLQESLNKWKYTFNNIKKNNIKSFMEVRLFEDLLNEIQLLKDNKNPYLHHIIEHYIEKSNLVKLDTNNNYKILNIIFSIIEITNYQIINLQKFNNLKNEIIEYNDKNDELYQKILNYKYSFIENEDKNNEYTTIMKKFLISEAEFKNFHFKNYPCSSNNICINRINKELISFKNYSLISKESSIFLKYDKDDHKKMMALITGPKNTPYENGCFIFHILINDNYPNTPPKIYFERSNESKIELNPNLHSDGKVILSLLGNNLEDKYSDNWDKDHSTLLDILTSIQKKIFVKEPLFLKTIYKNLKLHEKKNELCLEYNKNIKQYTYQYAILDKLKNPNEEFKNIILNHFKLIKNDSILKDLDFHNM